MRRLSRLAVVCALLATAGCVHRPGWNSYRLLRQEGGQVLVPPGVERPDMVRRTFVAAVAAGRGHCEPEGGIRIEPWKKGIRVTVDRDALLQQREPGWLAAWSVRAEGQGCIAPGGGTDLANLIVESAPLDPAAAFRLLHTSVQSGYVELGPVNRLEVRSPILREGADPDAPSGEPLKISGHGYHIDVDLQLAPSVIGFETAWYGVERNAGRAGFHIAALSAERNIQGAVEKAAQPATDYFRFPPQAAYFRLFYKAEDNDVTAYAIGGSTLEDLDGRTRAVTNDLSECAKSPEMCLALPRRVGVNPFLVVRVNDSDVTVPWGASVAAAIQAAGVKDPAAVLPRLRVLKLYHGSPAPLEFDRQSGDILSLRLAGGERISWPAAKP